MDQMDVVTAKAELGFSYDELDNDEKLMFGRHHYNAIRLRLMTVKAWNFNKSFAGTLS